MRATASLHRRIWRLARSPKPVDILIGLLKSALMMGFVVVVIVVLAGMFMIVFGIATGIDRRIQD